jgi:hypothetical protein
MKAFQWLRRASVVAVVFGLAGCVAAPKTIYQWGAFQGSLYEYLRGNGADPGAQITKLEAEVEKNAAMAKASPPGLHGHLALLYSKLGDDANAIRHLQAERALFPESAPYIDFLLKNAARTASKS